MSQFDDEFEDDYGTGSNALAEARKAAKENARRAKELEAELQKFRSEFRKRELAETITARGLNPKIANLVPANIEPGEIGAWLDENADVFGVSSPQSADQPDSQPAVVAPDGADTFASVANTGTPPVGDEGQLLALIKGAKTPEELNKLIFGQ